MSIATMLARPACVTCMCQTYVVSCAYHDHLVLSEACTYMIMCVCVCVCVYAYQPAYVCAYLPMCVCVCGVCSTGMEGMLREVSARLLKYGLELQTPYTFHACKANLTKLPQLKQ